MEEQAAMVARRGMAVREVEVEKGKRRAEAELVARAALRAAAAIGA